MKKRLMAIAATLALASSLLLIPVPSTMADEPVNPVSPSYNEGTLVFEAETYSAKADSVYPANDQEKESLAGYSGGGFMRVIEGDITYNIKVPMAGAYAVHIFGANVDASGRKHDSVYINGTEYYAAMPGQGYAWQDVQPSTAGWDNSLGDFVFTPVASVNLTAGGNTIRIAKNNGGYLYYDKIVLTPAWTLSGGEQLVLDIEALPSAVQLTDKAAFEAVKARYEALDADEQAKVTNYSKVTVALDQIAELERAGIQDPTTDGDKLIYETELSVTNGGASISSDDEHFQNFSGTGYVQIGENGGFTMRINVPTAGQYLVYVTGAGTDAGDKCEYFKINDGAPWLIALPGGTAYQWADCQPGTENYTDGALTPAVPAGGFAFSQGENTLTFTANWGKSAYDKVVLVPYTEPSPGEALAADIGRLPAVVQLADKDKIQALKDRYDDLDDEEKAKVTNYNKLLEALNQIQELDKFNQPQQPVKVDNKLVYEAEHAVVAGGTSISSDSTNFQNFSGSGYVYLGDGGFTMKIHVPAANQYRVYVVAANDNNGARCDYLQINGAAEKWLVSAPAAPAYGWAMCQPGTENWVNNVLIPTSPEEGFAFREGENTLVFSANWGYCAYDQVILVPVSGDGEEQETPALEKVNQMIAAIPASVTAADKDAVDAAYAAYQLLSDKEKAEVSGLSRLMIARAGINALVQDPKAVPGTLRYEMEDFPLVGNTALINESALFQSFGGTGYVFLFDQKIAMDLYVPTSGRYKVLIVGGSDDGNNKCDYVSINGGDQYLTSYLGENKGVFKACEPGTENWVNNALAPLAPEKGYTLKSGKNTLEIAANWGYCCYDSVILIPLELNPDTGADSHAAMAAAGFGLAGLTVAAALLPKRRRNEI